MNHQRTVQFAVMCLQELDQHAGQSLTAKEISHARGVPFEECSRILESLRRAGILDAAAEGFVLRRPVEELTALEIIEAVWDARNTAPAFQLLYVARQVAAAQTTREYVAVHADRETATING